MLVSNVYTDNEVRKIIETIDRGKRKSKKRPRSKALVYFFATSGCRVRVIFRLRIKDLKPIQNCYAVTALAKSRDEYITFVTPEARYVLDVYLKIRKEKYNADPGTIPFEDLYLFDLSYEALRKHMYRLVKNAGVPSPINTTIIRGFRKRFSMVLALNKEINPDVVKLIVGYTTDMQRDDSCITPGVEKLFTEYQKVINDLTIFKDLN